MSGIFMGMSGASGISILDTQTVTRGTSASGTGYITELSGYRTTGTLGSITDGTSNLYSGAAITECYFIQVSDQTTYNGYVLRQLNLKITGTLANSGWTKIVVGTTEFTRASAAFTTDGTSSLWTWDIAIPNPYLSEGDPFTSTTTVKWY